MDDLPGRGVTLHALKWRSPAPARSARSHSAAAQLPPRRPPHTRRHTPLWLQATPPNLSPPATPPNPSIPCLWCRGPCRKRTCCASKSGSRSRRSSRRAASSSTWGGGREDKQEGQTEEGSGAGQGRQAGRQQVSVGAAQ